MQTKTTLALALASLLAIGGTAMAQQTSYRSDNAGWMQSRNNEVYNARAQAPRPFLGQANGGYGYDDAYNASRGSYSESNQPSSFGNPSLFDRAKGHID